MNPLVPAIGLWFHGIVIGLCAAALAHDFLSPYFDAGFCGFNVGAFVFCIVALTKVKAPV